MDLSEPYPPHTAKTIAEQSGSPSNPRADGEAEKLESGIGAA